MRSTYEAEATEAITSMPIGILEHEAEPSKAPRMEIIEYQGHGDPPIKINFPSYIIDGARGPEEIIPQAMHTTSMCSNNGQN